MNKPAHTRPLWLAALVMCLGVPLLFALFVLVTELLWTGRSGALGHLDFVWLSLLIGAPISAVATYLFALPALLWFRERGLLGIATVCAMTIFVGALVLPVALKLIFGGAFVWVLMAWGAAFGTTAGVIFCLVAGIPWRRRPT